MNRKFWNIVICTTGVLVGSSLYAQQVPVSAQVHQRRDVIVNGKVVKSLAADSTFYRYSDGSTLTLPAKGGNGTLWDDELAPHLAR